MKDSSHAPVYCLHSSGKDWNILYHLFSVDLSFIIGVAEHLNVG